MSEEKGTALAMLSMKERLVRESSNLSSSVINKIVSLKDRIATILCR